MLSLYSRSFLWYKQMNNLYIIHEVLCCYSGGIVIIAAPSLERCRELFIEKEEFDLNDSIKEFDSAITNGDYKVIENVNHEEGSVSFLYGSS